MTALPRADSASPRINGIALADDGEQLSTTILRQRACTELLRQAAIAAALLPPDDPAPRTGAISEAAVAAIDRLLEQAITVAEPDEAACRRHYETNRARFAVGERVHARHVLFAVTPGIDVNALRSRAESCLLELRTAEPGRFAEVAALGSNCPSGAEGGDLGWLEAADCAPEFGRELFGHDEIGVLGRLVASRYGWHVVEVLERQRGAIPSYASARPAIAARLRDRAFATALACHLAELARGADLVALNLDRDLGLDGVTTADTAIDPAQS